MPYGWCAVGPNLSNTSEFARELSKTTTPFRQPSFDAFTQFGPEELAEAQLLLHFFALISEGVQHRLVDRDLR